MRATMIYGLALAVLAACGDTDRPLRDMSAAGGGPDEFAVVPLKPLEIPSELSLPAPTPGAENRTDPEPRANAIAALGGSATAQVAGGVPAQDTALVGQVGRYGVDDGIRATLAAEDARVLERKRRTNIFNPLNRDRYFAAYVGQVLDPFAELVRLRDLGIAVPVVDQTGATEAIEQAEQTCVWRTVAPDNQLRRVCTPIAEGAQ